MNSVMRPCGQVTKGSRTTGLKLEDWRRVNHPVIVATVTATAAEPSPRSRGNNHWVTTEVEVPLAVTVKVVGSFRINPIVLRPVASEIAVVGSTTQILEQLLLNSRIGEDNI